MDAWIWIVAAVLVVVASFVFAARRAAGGVDPTQLLLDPDLVGRVRGLAQANQKLPAIKLLRDGTPGLGLAAAKLMVDKMAAKPTDAGVADPVSRAAQVTSADRVTEADSLGAVEMMPSASSVPLEVELEARLLKSDGRPVQAIKVVREQTGWGLRQAKDFVDGL